jgi:hypothetical protein
MISCACSSREIWIGGSSRPCGGPGDNRHFRRVGPHRHAHAAQHHHALRQQIHQLGLFLVVLIEQQVQLVERRPRHLPMVLLVQVAEHDRVGQHLIEVGHALAPLVGLERDRHGHERGQSLDFVSFLVR